MKPADIRHLPPRTLAAVPAAEPHDPADVYSLQPHGLDPAAIFGYPWGDPKPARHSSWTARLLHHQPQISA